MRFAVVGDGALEVSLAPAGDAAIEASGGVLGVQLDGLAAIGNGRIVVAPRREIAAAAVVGHGEGRIELDGLGVIGDGLIVLARGAVAVAPVIVGNAIGRAAGGSAPYRPVSSSLRILCPHAVRWPRPRARHPQGWAAKVISRVWPDTPRLRSMDG